MALNVPLICDWILKDDSDNVTRQVRFDFKPGDVPEVTVQDMMGQPMDMTMSVKDWRSWMEELASLVERVFSHGRAQWPRDIEPDLEVKFNADGTRLTIEALPTGNVFDRTVDFAVVDGVDSLILRAYAAYAPITLHMWRTFANSVDSLIELNNGGTPNRGL